MSTPLRSSRDGAGQQTMPAPRGSAPYVRIAVRERRLVRLLNRFRLMTREAGGRRPLSAASDHKLVGTNTSMVAGSCCLTNLAPRDELPPAARKKRGNIISICTAAFPRASPLMC
jgi:hypothetical protein